MSALIVIDVVAAGVVVAGFQLAFRQKAVRARWRRLRSRGQDQATGAAPGYDPLDSVLRTGGVMLMAFAITACAFANVMAHSGAVAY